MYVIIIIFRLVDFHKSLFQKAEEIMDEMGVVDRANVDVIFIFIKI